MDRYDLVIIGSGIIGLTVARELLARKAGSILLLDKEPQLGLHSSGRNSGVLHAGIYYTPDSLKARFCSQGARKMTAYAEERNLPLVRTGKVIVAASPETAPTVRTLYERAQANGIRAELIDEAGLKAIEPEASTHGVALYSPDTAVIDSKAALHALEEEVVSAGVRLMKGARIEQLNEREIRVNGETVAFGHLVNAAGLHADRIAHQLGVGERYGILPFKGLYRKLTKEAAARFRTLIYPAPDLSVPFLGIHITKTTSGEGLIGPTAIPAFGRENYGVLSGIDGSCFGICADLLGLILRNKGGFRKMMADEMSRYVPSNFLKAAQALAPSIRREDMLGIAKVGLRAQLFDKIEKKLVMDFVVEDGPRSTHILNAISPAFTSSMAFAGMIADRITQAGYKRAQKVS